MMRPPRLPPFVLVLALAASQPAFAAEPESGLFCPLDIEPSAGLTESVDAMQKRFLSVARVRSGYTLLLRGEVEDVLKEARVTDYGQSDASLAKVATAGKVQNAGYVSLRLTDRNELMLQGRVVRADGKLLKASMISVPRGTEPLLDALSTAAAKFFDQLNGKTPAVAAATPVTPGVQDKPIEVVVKKPSAPADPGLALRVAGLVLGGAGVATTVVGAVVFAGAGTVEKDAEGNVSSVDAPRVKEIRAQQGAALGMLTAGAALAVTGLVMALAAPTAPVTAAVAPRADGAMFVVEGSF